MASLVHPPGPVVGFGSRYARRALVVLFLANLLNFYDRLIPSLVGERIRVEFGLTDVHLGLMASAATVVYAVAGIPLGRLADTRSRTRVLGWGVAAWSGLTALNGAATNFVTFLLARCGVGIGEACCAPAANSLLADYFPATQRGRASGMLQLGIPLGVTLASFTVGPIAQASGSWHLPFFLAAVPGLVVAIALFRLREPARGAADSFSARTRAAVRTPIRTVLSVPTMRWIIASGVVFNFATTAITAFLAPLMQRYFGVNLTMAGVANGVAIGVAGVLGLIAGGWIADRARRHSEQARLRVGASSVLLAVVPAATCFLVPRSAPMLFVLLLGLSVVLIFSVYTTVYPSIHEVVEPRLRATAVAVYFAAMYLLGAAVGPLVVGKLSDRLATAAANGSPITTAMRAEGLHTALVVTFPLMVLLTGVCVWAASRRVTADAAALRRGLVAKSDPFVGA